MTTINVTGIGTLITEPKFTKLNYEQPAIKTTFLLEFPGYKDKTQVFTFEVWDSAATYMAKNAKIGDKIQFEAVPRNYWVEVDADNPENTSKVKRTKFRVSTFKIVK